MRVIAGCFLSLWLLLPFKTVQAQWPCAKHAVTTAAGATSARLDHVFHCATSGCCLQEAEEFLQQHDTIGQAPLQVARMLMMQAMLGQDGIDARLRRLQRAETLLLPMEQDDSKYQNTSLWLHILLAQTYAEMPEGELFGLHCVAVQKRLDAGVTDTAAIVAGSNQLTGYHAMAGNMTRASEAAHLAYRLGKHAPTEKLLNGAYLNLAFLKYNTGELDSALHYAIQGMEVGREHGFHYMESRAAQIMGFAFHDKGDYPEYLNMTEGSLAAIERTGNALMIANAYQQLANAQNKNVIYRDARKAAEQGLSYRFDQPHVKRELLRVMVEAADSLDDHLEAYRLQKQLADVKDEIHEQELEETLARLNAQYESERKDARIAELEAAQLREDVRNQQRLLLGISLLLLIVLIAGMALTIYRARRQQVERLLFDQQHENDRQMLMAVEEERRRISSILHDTVAGSLSGMTYLTDYINSISEPKQREVQLADLRQRLDALYGQVRDLSHELLPFGEYEGARFQERLAAFLENRFRPGPLELNLLLDHPEVIDNLTDTERMLMYRVMHEGISNAMKHSEGTEVTVESIFKDQLLTIRITDNGKGMGADSNGIGLANLRHLSEKHGAKLDIHTPNGGGTCVELQFKPTGPPRP